MGVARTYTNTDIPGVLQECFKNFVKEKINFLQHEEILELKHSKSANLKWRDHKSA